MHRRRLAWIAGICSLFTACTTLGSSETVGEQFRKALAQIDAQCKKDKLGPYLDPEDPEYLMKRNRTDCDILALKPYDPLATPEGRFAHSLKLPPPHDKPKDVYKPGMTAEEYFKALCETEAGEWVFRRVEGVRGVFQARSYDPPPASYAPLVFWTREKGEMNVANPQDSLVQPYQGRYDFLEVPAKPSNQEGSDLPFIRYFRGSAVPHKEFPTVKNNRFVRVPYIVNKERSESLRSRYGYTWRGVERHRIREYGIEGSELIIFDRLTKEVLAFRRFFVLHVPDMSSTTGLTLARSCSLGQVDGRARFRNPPHVFIQTVLSPSNQE